jgi:hypothetical protein
VNPSRFYEAVDRPEGPWTRCRICRRPGPHELALLAAEVEGRARMAAARTAADLDLDDLDRDALEAFPDPRSSFRMTP